MTGKSTLRLVQKKEIKALKRIAYASEAISQVESVVFFGSRARGDFDGSSDMDMLIVITDIRAKDRVIGVLHNIELEYDVPISPVIFTSKEYGINKKLKSSFIENVEKEGIVLYDSKRKRQDRSFAL
jgi:uncharacterized protein